MSQHACAHVRKSKCQITMSMAPTKLRLKYGSFMNETKSDTRVVVELADVSGFRKEHHPVCSAFRRVARRGARCVAFCCSSHVKRREAPTMRLRIRRGPCSTLSFLLIHTSKTAERQHFAAKALSSQEVHFCRAVFTQLWGTKVSPCVCPPASMITRPDEAIGTFCFKTHCAMK